MEKVQTKRTTNRRHNRNPKSSHKGTKMENLSFYYAILHMIVALDLKTQFLYRCEFESNWRRKLFLLLLSHAPVSRTTVLDFLKSDNIQFNTLVCWIPQTNDSSTKHLMFHAVSYRLRHSKLFISNFYKYKRKN